MTPTYRFLLSVLGKTGANALEKSLKEDEELAQLVLHRSVLAWLNAFDSFDYQGVLPGTDINCNIQKHEDVFAGSVQAQDSLLTFSNAPIYRVAAAIVVALGGDHLPVSTPSSEKLQPLGKSIDLLVKNQAVITSLLTKKILDPLLGYRLEHEHHESSPGIHVTRVSAYAMDGSHVGSCAFTHRGEQLIQGHPDLKQPHQNKGLLHAFQQYAQKVTGKKVLAQHDHKVNERPHVDAKDQVRSLVKGEHPLGAMARAVSQLWQDHMDATVHHAQTNQAMTDLHDEAKDRMNVVPLSPEEERFYNKLTPTSRFKNLPPGPHPLDSQVGKGYCEHCNGALAPFVAPQQVDWRPNESIPEDHYALSELQKAEDLDGLFHRLFNEHGEAFRHHYSILLDHKYDNTQASSLEPHSDARYLHMEQTNNLKRLAAEHGAAEPKTMLGSKVPPPSAPIGTPHPLDQQVTRGADGLISCEHCAHALVNHSLNQQPDWRPTETIPEDYYAKAEPQDLQQALSQAYAEHQDAVDYHQSAVRSGLSKVKQVVHTPTDHAHRGAQKYLSDLADQQGLVMRGANTHAIPVQPGVAHPLDNELTSKVYADTKVGACNHCAKLLLPHMAGKTPDWRPAEAIPEDHYALSELQKGDAELLDKGIEDLAPGEPVEQRIGTLPAHHQQYDYSHLLPENQKHLKLIVHERPDQDSSQEGNVRLSSQLYDSTSNPKQQPLRVGMVVGKRKGDAIHPDSNLYEDYHGKGLGQAMYEALYAHAYHKMGVREIHGGDHSAQADAAHKRLAVKHGFNYVSQANGEIDHEGKPRYGSYNYPLSTGQPPRQVGPSQADLEAAAQASILPPDDFQLSEQLAKAGKKKPVVVEPVPDSMGLPHPLHMDRTPDSGNPERTYYHVSDNFNNSGIGLRYHHHEGKRGSYGSLRNLQAQNPNISVLRNPKTGEIRDDYGNGKPEYEKVLQHMQYHLAPARLAEHIGSCPECKQKYNPEVDWRPAEAIPEDHYALSEPKYNIKLMKTEDVTAYLADLFKVHRIALHQHSLLKDHYKPTDLKLHRQHDAMIARHAKNLTNLTQAIGQIGKVNPEVMTASLDLPTMMLTQKEKQAIPLPQGPWASDLDRQLPLVKEPHKLCQHCLQGLARFGVPVAKFEQQLEKPLEKTDPGQESYGATLGRLFKDHEMAGDWHAQYSTPTNDRAYQVHLDQQGLLGAAAENASGPHYADFNRVAGTKHKSILPDDPGQPHDLDSEFGGGNGCEHCNRALLPHLAPTTPVDWRPTEAIPEDHYALSEKVKKSEDRQQDLLNLYFKLADDHSTVRVLHYHTSKAAVDPKLQTKHKNMVDRHTSADRKTRDMVDTLARKMGIYEGMWPRGHEQMMARARPNQGLAAQPTPFVHPLDSKLPPAKDQKKAMCQHCAQALINFQEPEQLDWRPNEGIPEDHYALSEKPLELKLTKAQSEADCPMCGETQFQDQVFQGCFCFRDLAKSVKTDYNTKGYVLQFAKPWDQTTLRGLLTSLKLR